MCNTGTIIKEIRTHIGLTQVELGKIVNTASNNISRHESNKTDPSSETFLAVLKLCPTNVDMHELINTGKLRVK